MEVLIRKRNFKIHNNTNQKSGTDLILETKELAKNEHNTGESTTGNSEVSGDNR